MRLPEFDGGVDAALEIAAAGVHLEIVAQQFVALAQPGDEGAAIEALGGDMPEHMRHVVGRPGEAGADPARRRHRIGRADAGIQVAHGRAIDRRPP